MASSKIKKKTSDTKPSMMPRQGAIPCLVLVAFALVVAAFFFFAAFRNAG